MIVGYFYSSPFLKGRASTKTKEANYQKEKELFEPPQVIKCAFTFAFITIML